eukprot:scaffold13559_cov42-Prasinocladus_malaysianus.AAC.1
MQEKSAAPDSMQESVSCTGKAGYVCMPRQSFAPLEALRSICSVVKAWTSAGKYDEGSAEVRRIVNRDLVNTTKKKDDSPGPKSLDDLEKIFETGDMSTLKDEESAQEETVKTSAASESPFAKSGGGWQCHPASLGLSWHARIPDNKTMWET